MRLLLRVLAVCLLALAAVLALLDATHIIATGEWTFTPVAESWRQYGVDALDMARRSVEYDWLGPLWDRIVEIVLSLPGWLVFSLLALGLYTLGRRRTRRGESRFA